MIKKISILACFLIFVCGLSTSAQNMDDVQINSIKITDNIYMLQGRGGNIGLCFGKNGIFIIDDQFAPLHDKITKAIKEISKGAVPAKSKMFVINTHFHGDHTGGNELMGKSGAVIIAHENVRKRLSTEQFSKFFNSTTPPLAETGLPMITFTTDITFHINDDSVHVVHMPPAHTDGDAIVHFMKSNVIHTGDIIFTGRYPIIDLERGGSVKGVIESARYIATICDSTTKVIPGHGNLTDKAGVLHYAKMLSTIRERVEKMVSEGKTLEQIMAAKPSAEFDTEYNNSTPDERFLGVIYTDVTGNK